MSENFIERIKGLESCEPMVCDTCEGRGKKNYLRQVTPGYWECPKCLGGFTIPIEGKAIRYDDEAAYISCPWCNNVEEVPFDRFDIHVKQPYNCVRCQRPVLVQVVSIGYVEKKGGC